MILSALLLLVSLPLWHDIQATSVNADTRRTEVVYYANRSDALEKGFRESENYLDLNGVWDFKYFDDHRNLAVPREWDRIRVPGNWEVQGHGVAIYVNHPYEFTASKFPRPIPGTLPEMFPAAMYHRNFSVPESWNGREIFLNLCGSKSGTYVYVNGQEVGYCEDSKDLARFRITPYLKEGDNELLLKIYRFSEGTYLECQDFWRISGLERDVYLSSETQDTGFDFSVVSTLAEDLETGLFHLELRSSAPTEVSYELLDRDGGVIADASYQVNGSLRTLVDTIPGVRRWSAETPELYTLLLKVNGEYTRFHVGFRRLEIATVKDGDRDVKAFLVNGQSVKFKGVNLHEHNPYTGHYLTRENILEDLALMRKANINGIRTCHYPQPREFYELCDSLGFYVYNEANIESHGMGYHLDTTLANKPEWYAKHIDRIMNMYRRTANYPCVTILSLGNEAGNGVNFYRAYKELKALEADGQNRPVCYERAEFEWNTDMIVPQYPGASWFKLMGEKYAKRPVCPSEYAHAMGNSTGSLDLQWQYIYEHPHLQGGFIWDWVDQGLWDAERVWTYGGDYGTKAPSDSNFLCNGIVNPDRDPHPAFYEVKHVYQEVSITPADAENGIFSLQNRFYFKDLADYNLRWWVERDGRKPFWWRRHTVRLNTAAQSSEELRLKLPRMKRPGEYRIFFEVVTARELPLLEKGTVIAFDEALIKDTSTREVRTAKGEIGYTDGDTQIVIRGPKVELVFDKADGIVKSWKVKGADMVNPDFGLQPNFWRPANDNDYGNRAPRRLARYRHYEQPLAVKAASEGNAVRISVSGKDVRASESYLVYPDGTLKIEVTTAPLDTFKKEIPRLGVRFRVEQDDFRYMGRGPVENYWDRCSGTFRSIWTSAASKEFYPYVRPQETGHHTDVKWLQIGPLTIVSGESFEFNALRQSVEDLDGGPWKEQTHICDVPFRDFTEVCLDYRMTGVGGYDSWGSRPELSRMLLSNQSYSYSFTLIPSTSQKATRYVYE